MSDYQKVKEWRAKQPNIREIRAEEARKWRANNPEVAKAIKQRYREKSKNERLPREAQQARTRRAADPEGQKLRYERWHTKRLAGQERIAGRPRPDLCEVCGELNLRIVFDHCHAAGHFRGWICDRCNKVLGMVKDSDLILNQLVRYLKNGKINHVNAKSYTIQ